MNQTRFQMISDVISQNKGKINLHELQKKFRSRLTSKMLRKYEISNQKFLRKYVNIEKEYQRQKSIEKAEWSNNERKLFIWFSVLFCNHLNKNYDQLNQQEWQQLSTIFFNKNALLLKFQAFQIQKNAQRVYWTNKEESILKENVINGKLGKWNQISRLIFFQTSGKYYKTSKQCRQHWFNYLDTNKVKTEWVPEEDLLLLETVLTQGRKWSNICRLLSDHRTEHMVKNRYNSLINGFHRSKEQKLDQLQIVQILIPKLKKQIQQLSGKVNSQHSIQESNNSMQDPISSPSIVIHETLRQNRNQPEQNIENSPSDNINHSEQRNGAWSQGLLGPALPASSFLIIMQPFSPVSSSFTSNWPSWNAWSFQSYENLCQNEANKNRSLAETKNQQ